MLKHMRSSSISFVVTEIQISSAPRCQFPSASLVRLWRNRHAHMACRMRNGVIPMEGIFKFSINTLLPSNPTARYLHTSNNIQKAHIVTQIYEVTYVTSFVRSKALEAGCRTEGPSAQESQSCERSEHGSQELGDFPDVRLGGKKQGSNKRVEHGTFC